MLEPQEIEEVQDCRDHQNGGNAVHSDDIEKNQHEGYVQHEDADPLHCVAQERLQPRPLVNPHRDPLLQKEADRNHDDEGKHVRGKVVQAHDEHGDRLDQDVERGTDGADERVPDQHEPGKRGFDERAQPVRSQRPMNWR